MRNRRAILYRVAALVLALAVGALALEAAVRLRQWWKYGSASPTIHEFALEPTSGLRIPRPGMRRGGISINSRGFRGPDIPVAKPAGTIRLAFLGGSTTYCAEVSSNEHVWPHLVTEALGGRYTATSFDYVNAGAPGYGTAESLRNLDARIVSFDPDVIVIYHATNDLSSDTRELAVARGLLSSRPDETSRLAAWSTLWFLLEKNWTVYRRQANARSGADRLEFDRKELAAGFHRRLSRLVQRAQEIAPVVVLVTFSHRVRREQTAEERLQAANTSLYYMPYMSLDGLLDAFDEYNRVIREVARDNGALLVDAAEAIPGDGTHFVDSVHFTDTGSLRMAELVSEALVEADALQSLVARRGRRTSKFR